MRRIDAVSLIGRGILGKCSLNPSVGKYPFPYFSFTSVRSLEEKAEPTSTIPAYDFSCIHGVDDARRSFHVMLRTRPEPPAFVFAKLLGVVVKMRQYDAALLMFDKLRDLGVVKECTMNIAINCYCLLNRVGFGLSIFGSFFKLGHEPDMVTFGTLIKGLFLANKASDGVEVFKKLLREKSCVPDGYAFFAVFHGLCKVGHTLMARDLLGVFEKGSWAPNVYSYNTIIDSLCKDEKGGMVNEADDLLKIMKQKNISPDIVTYSALIDGYSLLGEMHTARKLLDSLGTMGLEPDLFTYNIMINGYFKKGEVDEALTLFQEIPCKRLEQDTVTYNIMLQGLFCACRFDDGWKLFNKMVAVKVLPDIFTISMLLDSLCKTRQFTDAFSYLRILEEKGFNPDITTYSILIDGLSKDGKHDMAVNLFKELPSKGSKPNVVTYTIIVDSLCQQGLVFDAKDMLRDMEECGCKPNPFTCNIFARGLLKRKEVHEAIQFLESMVTRGFPADASTMSMIVDLFMECKDVVLLDFIPNLYPRK